MPLSPPSSSAEARVSASRRICHHPQICRQRRHRRIRAHPPTRRARLSAVGQTPRRGRPFDRRPSARGRRSEKAQDGTGSVTACGDDRQRWRYRSDCEKGPETKSMGCDQSPLVAFLLRLIDSDNSILQVGGRRRAHCIQEPGIMVHDRPPSARPHRYHQHLYPDQDSGLRRRLARLRRPVRIGQVGPSGRREGALQGRWETRGTLRRERRVSGLRKGGRLIDRSDQVSTNASCSLEEIAEQAVPGQVLFYQVGPLTPFLDRCRPTFRSRSSTSTSTG